MKKSQTYFFTIHVFLPLVIGLCFYIFIRPTNIILFHIPLLQEVVASIKPNTINTLLLPNFLLYTLPDALWLYAFMCVMIWLWQKQNTYTAILWILAAPLLAISLEVLQYTGHLSGTFDVLDIVSYLLTCLLVIAIHNVKLF